MKLFKQSISSSSSSASMHSDENVVFFEKDDICKKFFQIVSELDYMQLAQI